MDTELSPASKKRTIKLCRWRLLMEVKKRRRYDPECKAEAARLVIEQHRTCASPDRKLAARIVEKLYSEDDSPLQYRINRLGGRSRQEKWILQAELFNEIHRWVTASEKSLEKRTGEIRRLTEQLYGAARDFLKAAVAVWGDAWGHKDYMVTKPVTIKAMIRVLADLAPDMAYDLEGAAGVKEWRKSIEQWKELKRDFRSDGFYERFPAKGQVERVTRIYRELKRAAGIEK
jgi:hypothetical protein